MGNLDFFFLFCVFLGLGFRPVSVFVAEDLVFIFYLLTVLLCLQADLLQLLQPFGMVSKIVMLRAKNQVSSSFFRALEIRIVV